MAFGSVVENESWMERGCAALMAGSFEFEPDATFEAARICKSSNAALDWVVAGSSRTVRPREVVCSNGSCLCDEDSRLSSVGIRVGGGILIMGSISPMQGMYSGMKGFS